MFLKIHEPNQYYKWLLTITDRINMDSIHNNALVQYKFGLEGETDFYHRVKDFNIPMIWDLTLNIKGEAQYDFIFIAEKQIIHIDIKNYFGHYQHKNGNFISQKGYVHQGLISQLERAHQKLEQYLHLHQIDYKVVSKIFFNNPNFILNGYDNDPRILLPNKQSSILTYLGNLSSTTTDQRIGELLVQSHQPTVHQVIPTIDYTTIRKGVRCSHCGGIGLYKSETQRTMTCICGSKMLKCDFINQAITDIHILKNAPFTNRELSEYTNISKHTLKRYLNKNCDKIGTFKDAKYFI